jgi:hypothetical protein
VEQKSKKEKKYTETKDKKKVKQEDSEGKEILRRKLKIKREE